MSETRPGQSETAESAAESDRETSPGGAVEWLARGVLVVVSIAFALIFAEVALRILDFRHEPFTVTDSNQGNQPLTLALANESFVFDPWLLWKPRPDFGVFNDRGLRGEVPAPDDARFRIVVIGDSNTLGWINGSGANWPGFLGERLPADRFVLINAASWGWSSFQGVRRVIDTEDLRPDLVIFGFGANDGHQRGTTDRQFADRLGTFERWASWRLRDLVLAGLDLADRYRSPRSRVAFDEFEANLRRAHQLVTERGGDIAFTTRPFREASGNPASWAHYVTGYNAITRRVAGELGAGLIDHGGWSTGRRDLFTDSSHYTEHGHRAAARIAHVAIRHRLPAHVDEASRSVELARDPDRHHGFFPNNTYPRWSDGDAIFERIALQAKPGDRLLIKTYGWHPWRHDPDRLWVQVRANGRLLAPCERWPSLMTFRLPDDIGTIEVLRVTSATFIASEHVNESDHRRLGLDIERIGLATAAEAPCR